MGSGGDADSGILHSEAVGKGKGREGSTHQLFNAAAKCTWVHVTCVNVLLTLSFPIWIETYIHT